MNRTVELWALAFQTLVTVLLALVYYGLWRARRRPYDATWAMAWGSYAARLAFITEYIVTRRTVWLFLHQVATGVVALLLLHAAIQFSRQVTWRRRTMAWSNGWRERWGSRFRRDCLIARSTKRRPARSARS